MGVDPFDGYESAEDAVKEDVQEEVNEEAKVEEVGRIVVDWRRDGSVQPSFDWEDTVGLSTENTPRQSEAAADTGKVSAGRGGEVGKV